MIAAICLAAAGSFAPVAVEAEVAAGATRTLEPESFSASYSMAPVFHVRGALDFRDHFAMGVSFLSVQGGAGNARSSDPSAFAAWAGLASFRMHTSGRTQAFIEGGVGCGHLIRLQESSSFEHPALSGVTALAWRIASGLRFRGGNRFWGGFDVSYLTWHGVSQPAGGGSDAGAPAQTGFASAALLLMLTAAVDWKL